MSSLNSLTSLLSYCCKNFLFLKKALFPVDVIFFWTLQKLNNAGNWNTANNFLNPIPQNFKELSLNSCLIQLRTRREMYLNHCFLFWTCDTTMAYFKTKHILTSTNSLSNSNHYKHPLCLIIKSTGRRVATSPRSFSPSFILSSKRSGESTRNLCYESLTSCCSAFLWEPSSYFLKTDPTAEQERRPVLYCLAKDRLKAFEPAKPMLKERFFSAYYRAEESS